MAFNAVLVSKTREIALLDKCPSCIANASRHVLLCSEVIVEINYPVRISHAWGLSAQAQKNNIRGSVVSGRYTSSLVANTLVKG